MIHYDDVFNCNLKVYTKEKKIIANITSVVKSGNNCVDSREYKRTLNSTYFYKTDAELKKIVNTLSNSIIMKNYRNGHGGFRTIDSIEPFKKGINFKK